MYSWDVSRRPQSEGTANIYNKKERKQIIFFCFSF